MNSREDQPGSASEGAAPSIRPEPRNRRRPLGGFSISMSAHTAKEQSPQMQAEVFYLQKQIQAQTPMVIVLDDGERIEGCIEWYDSNVLKVRGRTKTLIYKSAIKYMHKLGEGNL